MGKKICVSDKWCHQKVLKCVECQKCSELVGDEKLSFHDKFDEK